LIKIRSEIEEIDNLMVNSGSICTNPKPRTTMKKGLKLGVDVEVFHG